MTIRLDNVSFAYSSDAAMPIILRDIDLTVVDGEFLVLLGPSGCGK